ncbi:MAG: tetratricopeptide repeat protein [Saprospiraceae bacterium]|nr:tetratricopeptide repeat protein [Saprospiraceae bacterium]
MQFFIPKNYFFYLCFYTGVFLVFQNYTLSAQDTGIRKIDSVLQLAATTDNPILKIDLLNSASFALIGIQTKKGLELAEEALALAEKINANKQSGDAANSMASHLMMLSVFDKAISNYLKAIDYYQKANHEKGLADIYGNLGNLYYFLGEYSTALAYQFKALPVFEKLNYKSGLANTFSGIGNIYMIQNSLDEALRFDSIALQLYQETKDSSGIALVYGNLGNIFNDKGNIELAVKVFEKAIQIYESLGVKDGLARNLSNLSTLIIGKKDYLKAYQLLKKAHQVFKEIEYTNGMILSIGNIGICHYKSYLHYDQQDSIISILPGKKSEHLEKAIQLFSQSISIAEEIQDLESIKYFTNVLTELYNRTDQKEKAYPVFKKYVAAKDSLNNIESKKQIQKLITEREVALKDKQIELDKLAVEKKRNERLYFLIGLALMAISLLFIYRNFKNQKKSNLVLEKLNAQIGATNAELASKNDDLTSTLVTLKQTQEQLIFTEKQKENAFLRSKISQDIHDDISSGLTKISWLAETLKAKSANTSDSSLIDRINNFSREAVIKLGEIIWSTNPERDNLPSLLTYMRSFLNKFFEDSQITCNIQFPDPIPELPINPELRRNIFLVFKEALHNTFKYSKASKLDVHFSCENYIFQLSLKDNGIGFEEGSLQGSGNGLRNMERRMQAIGGSVQITSVLGKGTQILFTGKLFA